MVLEHVGMPQPGDCRVVFSASAEELEAAIQAEQAAENPPQAEEDLLTAAVNRAPDALFPQAPDIMWKNRSG